LLTGPPVQTPFGGWGRGQIPPDAASYAIVQQFSLVLLRNYLLMRIGEV